MKNNMSKKESIAWAAGIFEGEGCISLIRHKQKNYISNRAMLCVTNTDLDILIKFREILGIGYVRPLKTTKLSQGRKQLYRWIATSFDEFDEAIKILKPFMSNKRLSKLEKVLSERTPRKYSSERAQCRIRPKEIIKI